MPVIQAIGDIDSENVMWVVPAWIERHCSVPAGYLRGQPIRLGDWQLFVAASRWTIRGDAEWVPPELVGPGNPPLMGDAFKFSKTMVVLPQKIGKGPVSAAFTLAEAVGPTVFAGRAKHGDMYRCADNRCPCGWEYPYRANEPKGSRHPSPLIQLTATSDDQAENIYGPVRAMIGAPDANGNPNPLKAMLAKREGFVRILGLSEDNDLDRIDVVTASAQSRLGNPISDAEQDEVGRWLGRKMHDLHDTQERGAAAMGGRVHLTTNAWDPTEKSVAQRVYDFAAKSDEVWVYFPNPRLESSLIHKGGKPFDFKMAKDRKAILDWLYGDSWWVNRKLIESKIKELLTHDPAQAERFYGNLLSQGLGAWLDISLWTGAYAGRGE